MKQDSIYHNIRRQNEHAAREIALSYFGENISYQMLFEQAEACAQAFWRQGIRPGDAVLICTAGVPEAVYALLGLWKIGASAHLLNPTASPQLLRKRIRESGASVLLVLDRFLFHFREILPKLKLHQVVVLSVTASMPASVRDAVSEKLKVGEEGQSSYLAWESFIDQGEGTLIPLAGPEAPAIVLYPSGIPEKVGGIELTHEAVNQMIWIYQNRGFSYGRQERFLHIVPLWYSTGVVITLLVPLCLGMTVLLEPRFQPKAFAAALRYASPHHVVASTTLWLSAMQYPDMQAADLSNLRSPYTGVANEILTPESERILNRFLMKQNCPSPIQKAYGLCELGGTVSCTTGTLNKPGSVGVALPGVRIGAFAPDTDARLPVGEIGELYVSTPCCMNGYFHNPEATHAFFYRDAFGSIWGRTGHMGYVDEQGAVFLTDCERKLFHR